MRSKDPGERQRTIDIKYSATQILKPPKSKNPKDYKPEDKRPSDYNIPKKSPYTDSEVPEERKNSYRPCIYALYTTSTEI